MRATCFPLALVIVATTLLLQPGPVLAQQQGSGTTLDAGASVSVVDTENMVELSRIEVGQGPRRNHTALLP